MVRTKEARTNTGPTEDSEEEGGNNGLNNDAEGVIHHPTTLTNIHSQQNAQNEGTATNGNGEYLLRASLCHTNHSNSMTIPDRSG
jgi:hypothetical protein